MALLVPFAEMLGVAPGIAERVAGLEGRTAPELRVGNLERFDRVSDRAVVKRAVEVRGHAEYSAAQALPSGPGKYCCCRR